MLSLEIMFLENNEIKIVYFDWLIEKQENTEDDS